jgi:PAT family acetyl-CoA transporter-like MFS transporter 1
MIVLLLSKFGFQANEAVTNLKLLEKGFSKEDLALTVLIDFPFSIFFGYYAAKWSSGPYPLKPWMLAFVGRLLAAVSSMVVVYMFPSSGVGMTYFILVILAHLGTSFMSTVMFVSSSAFHTQIADPIIGGTYLTLLNTVSNLGGTWPRFFILEGVDYFTRASCILAVPTGNGLTPVPRRHS